MSETITALPWTAERHADLVSELLGVLGKMFDLTQPVAGTTLHEAVRRRLEALFDGETPVWGEAGAMTEIARRSHDALEFLYRPHLFPDMDDALRLAHQLQFDLLPRTLPAASPVAISAVLESYCHLSGDLLGWRREGDELVIWIADVSGHGVRAGLAAAVFYMLTVDLAPGLSPAEATAHLSDSMLNVRNPRDESVLYATSFCARLDRHGKGHYSSAGHPPMMLRRPDGRVERYGSTGPPIGLLPDARFSERSLALEVDDLLLLFTDGLTEATDIEGHELGLDWIERQVEGASTTVGNATRGIYEALTRATDRSNMEDDLTFMAIALGATPP